MANHISGTISSIAVEYDELLNHYFIDPLMNENVHECINRLDEYGLTKDDLVEGLNYCSFNQEKSLYDQVPTKIKTALTRTYAKENHPTTNFFLSDEELYSQRKSRKRKGEEVTKEKKKGKAKKIEEEEEEEEMEENENDDLDYYPY